MVVQDVDKLLEGLATVVRCAKGPHRIIWNALLNQSYTKRGLREFLKSHGHTHVRIAEFITAVTEIGLLVIEGTPKQRYMLSSSTIVPLRKIEVTSNQRYSLTINQQSLVLIHGTIFQDPRYDTLHTATKLLIFLHIYAKSLDVPEDTDHLSIQSWIRRLVPNPVNDSRELERQLHLRTSTLLQHTQAMRNAGLLVSYTRKGDLDHHLYYPSPPPSISGWGLTEDCDNSEGGAIPAAVASTIFQLSIALGYNLDLKG